VFSPRPARIVQEIRVPFGLAGVNFRSRRTGKWWRGACIAEQAGERHELEAITDRIDVTRMEALLAEPNSSKTIPYL
jgi:hypothetical protein